MAPHRRTRPTIARTLLLAVAFFMAGCVAHTRSLGDETVEEVLPAALEEVRAAIVVVLQTEGYPVRESDEPRIVTTEYRREMDTMWDWLLSWRFGIERSKVNAVLSPEPDRGTRLTISVDHQGKSHVWSTWEHVPPPPHQSAQLYLASVKKILGLL